MKEEVMLRAVRDHIDERLRAAFEVVPTATVSTPEPAPEPAPDVHVIVDMTPVAEAIEGMTRAVMEMRSMMVRLIGVLADQPAPVVRVPKAQVTVQVPEQPAPPPPPERPKRTLKIRHDDGTESTISEE